MLNFLLREGVQPSQPVTFLSDGGDTVWFAQLGFGDRGEYILDWFHIAIVRVPSCLNQDFTAALSKFHGRLSGVRAPSQGEAIGTSLLSSVGTAVGKTLGNSRQPRGASIDELYAAAKREIDQIATDGND